MVRRSRVRARGLWWRVDFDGYEVTAVRRAVPIPRLRARRVALPDVICSDLPSMGGEDERRQLYLYLRGGGFLGIGHRCGVRTKHCWFVIDEAINLAVRTRELHVLRSSVGLGPWSEEEWARVEALVPELTAFATHEYKQEPRYPVIRVEISHRVGVEEVLSRLRTAAERPYSWPGGKVVLKERNIHDPTVGNQDQLKERGDAWAALIDRLQNGVDPTPTAP